MNKTKLKRTRAKLEKRRTKHKAKIHKTDIRCGLFVLRMYVELQDYRIDQRTVNHVTTTVIYITGNTLYPREQVVTVVFDYHIGIHKVSMSTDIAHRFLA